MRIAIISDGVHPYVLGGMQRHTFYLCKYLSRNDVKVTLVHFNQSTLDIAKLEIFTNAEKQNIESIVIPFPDSDSLPGHYLRASYHYSTLVYEHLKYRWKEFDFIYTKGFSGWKLIEEKQKSPSNFPSIGVKFHGYEMFQKQADLKSHLKSLLLRRPVKWITNHADYVFSYGSKITQIISSLGVNSQKIIEIPAGIEASWLSQTNLHTNNPTVFTYLGRYERRKGIEELNSVLSSMPEKEKNYTFHFIGPFEEKQKIQKANLIYHGSITNNSEIMEILDGTDFLVCPSWSEGMPNVILEAMSRGCAIIATNVGAVSIMVGSDNGFLIQPGNKKELRSALFNALSLDKDQLLEMKQNSLNKVRKMFQYDTIIHSFINKINSIKSQ